MVRASNVQTNPPSWGLDRIEQRDLEKFDATGRLAHEKPREVLRQHLEVLVAWTRKLWG